MPKQNIQELSFAEVIGDRFGRYSKYIIQDRALPDIRDGLKPVQRRILFAMHQDRNTYDRPHRKSARTVGNVIGNYHPHGDSSVYEAMVRMSQDWKLREPLIDMHGNNGSMDGDPAAAMRYTEARLSKIAAVLLQDLEDETVDFAYNFDDTMEEPIVLPARYPNLLVNGATGISAGYATEIPPHNLAEVIDALIYMLTHDEYTLADLLQFIKGPDFPTGGIIQGAKDLEETYAKGQGRLVIRAVTEIESLRGNKSQIVVTELPYEVNKSKLVQKLDDIRLSKDVDGIAEVRDESDRNGLRLVIELRREMDAEGILDYLFLNTDLQVNYHFNMVAISHLRPKLVSLTEMLEAYLDHQREVITRRTTHRLAKDEERLHIVDGLIRVMSILDEVVALIRNSQNKQDAKENLAKTFDFSLDQAEAIVSLQLYRLTNTDVVTLEEERQTLNDRIQKFREILASQQTLHQVLIDELLEVKADFQSPRRTQVMEEVETINVETHVLVPEESVYVSVTKEGYIKRTSLRSYSASQTSNLGLRDNDQAIFIQEMSTHDAIVIVTNRGNYIHLPVHELPDIRWSDLGQHWSQDYQLESGEAIVNVFKQTKETLEGRLVFMTRQGMIKQTEFSQFETYRSYKTRTSVCMNVADDDEVIAVWWAAPNAEDEVVLLTHQSYSLRYPLSEVSTIGLRTKGMIAINLKEDDHLVNGFICPKSEDIPEIVIATQRGNIKRFAITEIPEANRATRGLKVLRELKSNSHRIVQAVLIPAQTSTPLKVQGDTGFELIVNTEDLPLTERLNNGSALPKLKELGQVIHLGLAKLTLLETNEETVNK